MSHKSYIVIFKSDAPSSAIDQQIKEVEGKGGKITQRYDQDFMKGFAASMPEEHGKVLTESAAGDKHEHISYVEPDGQVSTSA